MCIVSFHDSTYLGKILHFRHYSLLVFAREYSIWNAAVAALHFWMAELNPQTLSNAIEQVYTAFLFSTSYQQLRSTLEEVLFGHFMTTLSDTFEQELALEDKGYNSGNENLSILTLLHRAPHLYHVSASENLSFRPATPQAYSPQHPGNLKTVCCCLTFEEDDDSSIDSNKLHARTGHWSPAEYQMACLLTSAEEEEDQEEHLQTAPLDDDVQMEETFPDRHLCIHEHSQHDLYPYPCQYIAWINYTSLWIMHQHLSTWTSVTFLTS